MKISILSMVLVATICHAEDDAQKSKVFIPGGYGIVFGTDVSRDIQAKRISVSRSSNGSGSYSFTPDRPITYYADFKEIPVGNYQAYVTPKNRVYRISAEVDISRDSKIKEPEKFRDALIKSFETKYGGKIKFSEKKYFGSSKKNVAEYCDPRYPNRRMFFSIDGFPKSKNTMSVSMSPEKIYIDYLDTKLENADRDQPAAGPGGF